MRIVCVGISHKTADVALREKLAFDADQTADALDGLSTRWPQAEFVLLSTCNRTEIYTARPVHGHPRQEELIRWLGEYHNLPTANYKKFEDSLYTLADVDAIRQLFSVAAGLDSLVIGECQIIGQMKQAYAAATRAGTSQKIMNELFQAAFRTAKQVRSETSLADGKVSVASVAIDFVINAFQSPQDLSQRTALNIGAGKMNELMLRHLAKLGIGKVLVANRSLERADQLASQSGGTSVSMDDIPTRLAETDIVLASTASPKPILTREMVAAAQVSRNNRPLLIVDIAVPRDVEPEVGNIQGVSLYNIDDLEHIIADTIKLRHGQLSDAEAIVAEHAARITDNLNVRDVVPTIEALYKKLEIIADEELAEARNKLSDHDDADEDEEILKRTLHRMIRRILHPAATNLKLSAGSDAVRSEIAAIRKLFDLD